MAWKFADELEEEYRRDLKHIKQRLQHLKSKQSKLKEYKSECEEIGKWDEIPKIIEGLSELKETIRILGSVVSSSNYSIEWLRDAREPGAQREISSRSRFQRTQLWSDMDAVIMNKFRFEQEELTDEDLQKLDDFMATLTDKEKDAINSVVAKGNSYQETADFMGVSRSTVQSYVNRGMQKINNSIENGAQISLF